MSKDSGSKNIIPEKLILANSLNSFEEALMQNKLVLQREKTTTCQINVGYLCNLSCRHCHLTAGPDRKEIMTKKTAEQVIQFAKQNRFDTIDITGGAPEMNPNIEMLIENLTPLCSNIIIRSNLIAINSVERKRLISILKKNRVSIVASFPSINEAQTNAQRGDNIFQESIKTLKKLNKLGYGNSKSSGLELNLVSNPTGAFMPSSQKQVEKRFRTILDDKFGIQFDNLYSFANVPLGRFKTWLKKTNNFDGYMEKLITSFNPCAVQNLMCKNLISIAWDGYLFDCDFNHAKKIPMGGVKIHISQIESLPTPGLQIATTDHCFTCTAGAGFT
ncbi:arsenosugar biosynthesis radical SAM protein ArsS [Desulfobacterales bacterium HSG17]|nr:arsenosugar biosynthesis radical SAM protein ArsS [Desulfobacterales bacterium HSG17]